MTDVEFDEATGFRIRTYGIELRKSIGSAARSWKSVYISRPPPSPVEAGEICDVLRADSR